ncbi:hypothetical protein CUMW_263420 [Citrus unshiu]|uniref:Uncharacterized protein n=1 Tax=Citrus unshiu TaxID=55188 RepID=A0A2H5QUV6_CITUN|nr:hypothetical protein CUMW_263420 [Citrus unshiu]
MRDSTSSMSPSPNKKLVKKFLRPFLDKKLGYEIYSHTLPEWEKSPEGSLAIASDPSVFRIFVSPSNDFKIKTCGHNIPKSVANQVSSTVTTANVEQIPGHNTTRHIYSSYRLRGKQRPNPHHSHHCAPEILSNPRGQLSICSPSDQIHQLILMPLARAFQLDPYVVKALQAKFGAN